MITTNQALTSTANMYVKFMYMYFFCAISTYGQAQCKENKSENQLSKFLALRIAECT